MAGRPTSATSSVMPGETVQPPRLCKVLRPALAMIVHHAEAALRICSALRRGEAVQPPRLRQVHRPALASMMHQSEAELCFCSALCHSFGQIAPVLGQARHGGAVRRDLRLFWQIGL